jgi:hypothetical protein
MILFRYYFTLSCFLLISLTTLADSGVKGSIKNSKGEALSFASILVKGASKGTMANEDGQYELSLPSGNYTLVFQYLSHKTLEKNIEVKDDYLTVNVSLEEQSISLNEIKFSAQKEDPAYTIMRKAISMSRFHILEISSYSARTYVKGTGKIKDVTGIVKLLAGKKIEKETGLKIGQTYILESINDIAFAQPNVIKEKIISNRSNFPPQLQSNSGNLITFARTNFYAPKIGPMISPLSPSALAYYRFSYEGMFEDRGVQVNKIRITPKSSGEDVFSGTINIIEDSWAIHSLDLRYKDENGDYTLKQLFSPFKDVWMPVYFDAGFSVSVLGIEAEGRYVTNVRNYAVNVNPKYHQQPVVIDEKIDKAEAKELKKQGVDKSLALKQQQLTRKQLKKVLKDFEKEDKKERKAQNEDITIVRDYSLEVDSLSKKRSNDFWNTERQVPLTDFEVKGYQQADSLNKVNEDKNKKDSIRNLPKFKLSHILTGKYYNYGKRDILFGYQRTLSYNSPLTNNIPPFGSFANAVEGYYLDANIRYTQRNKLLSRMEIGADARYSLGRQRLNGTVEWNYIKNYTQYRFKAGRFVYQFNEQQPITPFGNLLYTLLWEQNFMKVYEKTFVNAEFRHQLSAKLTALTDIEWSERSPLENLSNFKSWIDVKDRVFESNTPAIAEANNANFQQHNSVIWNVGLTIRPFAKTSKFNGREYISNYRNPIFRIKNRMGLSESNKFHRLEAEYEQVFDLKKIGDLHLFLSGGGFIDKPTYITDYKHFNGNQIFFRRDELFNSFRNLSYYQFSTTGNYFQAHAQQDFRTLLLSKINVLRLYGIKESVFANYLHVANQKLNYVEVGYGISGIGKFLGLEVVSNFMNGKYDATVLRVKFNR